MTKNFFFDELNEEHKINAKNYDFDSKLKEFGFQIDLRLAFCHFEGFILFAAQS